MEKINEIINIVLGSGLIISLLFYGSKKRKQQAEADVSEFEALKMQIKHLGEQLQEAYVENDKMQDIIDKQREKLVEHTRTLSEVRIVLIKEEEKRLFAEYNMCTLKNCEKRQPPREEKNG